MFILGLLSIFQITFLPGLVIQKIAKINKGILQTIIFSFALSLVFNHLFVIILTHLGINYSIFHYILFAIEIVALIILYSADLNQPIGKIIRQKIQKYSDYLISSIELKEADSKEILKKTIMGAAWAFFLLWAIFSLSWAISYLTDNFGTVFTFNDSIVSWNHWASEWFSNTQPLDTKRYAQLVPTNFSVTYSFMRSDQIQFFAKGFMPLFAIYILLMMLDLGLEHRNLGYIIGLVATRYILNRFYSIFISSGYVDVAVAFFTLVTVYTLIKSSKLRDEELQIKYVFLGFVFAAGTALTKQNGLIVFVTYPFLAYGIIFRKLESLSSKEKITRLATYFGISLLIIMPWYVFNEIRIMQGAKTNVLGLMSKASHQGRTRWERVIKAVKDISVYAYLYPFILLTLPFIEKQYRKIIYFILIPYSLIWALLFSRYTRNLSIAYPLLGLFTGLGAAGLLSFTIDKILDWRFDKIRIYIIALVLVLGTIMGGLMIPDQVLIDNQREQQKEIIDPEVNKLLYDYFGDNEFEPIFTNYQLRYLPGFEDLQIKIGGFEDIDIYHQKLAEHPDVNYMLISLWKDNDEVMEEVNKQIDLGKYELVFKTNRFKFIRILER
jgi:hypothetical protein